MPSVEPPYDGPEAEAIQHRSADRWRSALSNAQQASRYPVSPSDLKALLCRTPAFPSHLPGDSYRIQGYSTWRNTGSCTLSARQEQTRDISLAQKPRICRISTSGNFQKWGNNPNNGLTLMFLGWVYVLSASLAERKQLPLHYQVLSGSTKPSVKKLRLEYSSCHERTWWKSLVSGGVNWKIAEGHSPWGVYIEDVDLEVVGQVDETSIPPSASQAASYLGRLCYAFDLGNQSSAGLAAALTLSLQPSEGSQQLQLPVISMGLTVKTPNKKKCLPPEFPLISYYMTLSLCEWALGPTLWSVFWEPNIPCNFAGAWLGPLSAILNPILSSNNMELLAKIFSSTKAAPLWVGIAICGPDSVIRLVLPYLTKLYDYPLTLPSIDAAAWTGIPHSFYDSYKPEPCRNGTISRVDVWRLRHDLYFEYEDDSFLYLPHHGWHPFGRMREEDVELEIRNHIYCTHRWDYSYWTWLPESRTDTGFCKSDETPVNSPAESTSRIVIHNPTDKSSHEDLINRYVSESATKSMFSYCRSQVEKGFGGTIVYHFRGFDERLPSTKGSSPALNRATIERIRFWRAAVGRAIHGKGPPRDTSSDETSSNDSSSKDTTSEETDSEDTDNADNGGDGMDSQESESGSEDLESEGTDGESGDGDPTNSAHISSGNLRNERSDWEKTVGGLRTSDSEDELAGP